MIRSILALLFSFLLFNCGGEPDIREDPRSRRKDRDLVDELLGGRRGNLQECKGTGYTIYTEGDCQRFKDIGNGKPSLVDGIATHQLDILFIVDSSGSMNTFLQQDEIQKKFMYFLSDIKALDWRILITDARYYKAKGLTGLFRKDQRNGTAMYLQNSEGRMDRKYLDSTVMDYEDIFLFTLSRGEYEEKANCSLPPGCSGRNEQPLKALRSSFLLNQEWTRKNADFVTVIMTNTDESKMENTNAEELVDSIIQEFESVYGAEKRLFTFSIIIMPEDTSCREAQKSQQGIFKEARFGTTIAELAKTIGGGNFSICSKDFSPVSKAIVKMTSE